MSRSSTEKEPAEKKHAGKTTDELNTSATISLHHITELRISAENQKTIEEILGE
jgi:hypothetical protein